MPLFGPPNVQQLQAKRDVQGLIKALGYQKDSQVRLLATSALSNLGDTRAVEPLITLLKDSDAHVQRMAAFALGTLKDNRAVEPLIALLEFKWTQPNYFIVQQAAAEALGKLKDRRAVEPLITIINVRSAQNEVKGIQEAAVEALGAIGSPIAAEPLIALLKDTNASALIRLTQGGAPAADFRTDNSLLAALTRVLGRLGDVRAVEPLLAMLKAPGYLPEFYESMKTTVQEALANIRDPRAVEPLTAALKERTPASLVADQDSGANLHIRARATMGLSYMRTTAARALGNMRDPRAVDPLIEALKDGEVAAVVAEVLGNAGDPRAVDPLIEAFKDNHMRLRQVAAGEPSALQPYQLLGEMALFRATAEALGKLKDPRATEPLVAMLEDSQVKNLVKEQIKSSYARDQGGFVSVATMRSLGGAELDARWESWIIASKALGELGDPHAVKALIRLTSDEIIADTVIEALRRTLVLVPTDIATEDLRSVLRLDTVRQFNLSVFLSGISYYHKEVDCSQVKLLAKQEMVRRGLED